MTCAGWRALRFQHTIPWYHDTSPPSPLLPCHQLQGSFWTYHKVSVQSFTSLNFYSILCRNCVKISVGSVRWCWRSVLWPQIKTVILQSVFISLHSRWSMFISGRNSNFTKIHLRLIYFQTKILNIFSVISVHCDNGWFSPDLTFQHMIGSKIVEKWPRPKSTALEITTLNTGEKWL